MRLTGASGQRGDRRVVQLAGLLVQRANSDTSMPAFCPAAMVASRWRARTWPATGRRSGTGGQLFDPPDNRHEVGRPPEGFHQRAAGAVGLLFFCDRMRTLARGELAGDIAEENRGS